MKFSLDIEGFKDANSFLIELSEKMEAFNKKLEAIVSQAVRSAQAAYGSGATVTYEILKNGFRIIANGEGITFLEFGAGVTADPNNEMADAMDFSVYPGSWSEDHAREFIMYGYWHFGGHIFYAVAPRKGMHSAYKVIVSALDSAVKELQ